MTQEEYIDLHEKFLAGNCSPEEIELLNEVGNDFLIDGKWQPEMGDERAVKHRIQSQIRKSVAQGKVIRLEWLKWVAAACVLISISYPLFRYLSAPPIKTAIVSSQNNIVKTDISPGNSKAILTLANGSSIVLNNSKKGILAKAGNTSIIQKTGGELSYQPDLDVKTATNIQYNVLKTPPGGEYQLQLPDGTRVWLNAASSIKFPNAFAGANRRVELVGEAYFEVSKNPAMPFIVAANGTETRVLGTHFNVMAYPDEPGVTTTLFEGSVKFSRNKSDVLLTPGNQALLNNATNLITVQKANLEEVLAWKNGYFNFQDEDIHSIMRKVARWYNVEVVYDAGFGAMHFDGTLSRYNNISDLLKMLQSTGTIHFKVEGRRITVMR